MFARPVYQLVCVLCLSVASGQIIPGDPPSFESFQDPQDKFVYERNADNNPVSLKFTCPVNGTDPEINWYRKVDGIFMLDNDLKQLDDSYVFPDITEADSAYASEDGIEYYCTATNDFGIIRSRTARAFYADFKGFAIDGQPVPEDVDPEGRTVDVVIADALQQWVSLECEVVPGSIPTPAIQWNKTDTGGTNPEVLTEDFTDNRVRFIDGGRLLILETTTDAVNGTEYYCFMTNKQKFQTVRGPITYTLNPVTSFLDEPDGLKLYNNLTNSTVPQLVEFDPNTPASSLDRVEFGVGVAYSGPGLFTQTWRVNRRTGDSRVATAGPVASILPVHTATDTSSELEIELIIGPTQRTLMATLTLEDPVTTADLKPDNVDDRLSGEPQSFTCSAGGSSSDILFYHNGVKLEGGVNGSQIDGGTLKINSTSTAHTGMYQCIADESGLDGFSWYLIVRDPIPPAVVTSYMTGTDPCVGFSFIQQDNPPIILFVAVTADPCPSAVWTKDGGDLPPSGGTVIDGCRDFELGNTFVVFSLSVEDLTEEGGAVGAYGVTFTNVAGSVSVPTIMVTGRVKADITAIRSDPNSPIVGTDTGCLSAGTTAKIICENVGFPVPVVEFWKDGILIHPGDDDRLILECNTLIITGVAAVDKGTYTCRVQNNDDQQYEDISDTPLKLEYCIKPNIVGDPTVSKMKPEERDETSIPCQWTGYPDPLVTWYKDGSPLREQDLPFRMRITEDRNGEIFHSSLDIYQVVLNDTGEYICNVSNPVGFDTRIIRLEVQARSTARSKGESLSEEAVGLAVGLSIGLSFLGLLILVSVLAVLLFMWQVKKSSDVGQPVPYCVPFSGTTLANAAREGAGMRENSAYVSQEVESTDDDTTYDTIAEQ